MVSKGMVSKGFVRRLMVVVLLVACDSTLRRASAQSVTWIGSGTNANWSTAANWASSGTGGLWVSGTGINVTVGSVAGSGTTFQNRNDYSGGVRIGSLTLASPTPFTVTGSPIYLNGSIVSTGSASRSVLSQVNLQRPTTTIDVDAGAGRLTIGNLVNSSSSAATLRKTGGGELLLSGYWTSGSATTFTLEQGTVSLAAAARQGFTPPASVALGQYGNGNFTAGVLRLDGGNLRAAVTGATPFGPQYFVAPVTQDTILSGSNVSLGDPTGSMNARLQFSGGLRIDEASRVTVYNETILTRFISGSYGLTVSGSGRLSLQGSGSSPATRLSQLTVDGGGVGVTSMSLAGLPADGLTLVNGGRLDSLSSFTVGGTSSQKITIGEGGGVLRSASPMSFADMMIQAGGLQGSGTLRVESTQPLLPPNMPAGYYIQPGRIVVTGSNADFTGNTVVNGGELQVRSLGGLGNALLPGGTQAIDVRAGILNISGSTFGAAVAPDLSRVTVNKGATLKLSNSGSIMLTAATVPATPIAGLLGLENSTLTGSTAAIRIADGAIVQNSGVSGIATLRTNVAYASAESGTITLAGSYIPNRRASWGGELVVNGQLTSDSGAGGFDLAIKGAGVVMNVAQNSFAGQTTIDNGRLVLQHVNGLGGPGRVVTIKPGAQLDLTGTFTSGSSLPAIHANSAGMIGIGTGVSGTVLQSMSRGANSIGPSYYTDYTYSLSSLPAVDGVYRFGTVSMAGNGNPNPAITMVNPKSFTITQSNVLSGNASVVVGAVKGDAFGSGGSALTLRANQNYTGGTLVKRDFFLAVDQALSSPFGSGAVTVQGTLLATGSAGSFINMADITSQVTFAKGGELWLDNGSGINANRWGDTTPIVLEAGAIRMGGNSSQAVSETVGALVYSGGSKIYMYNPSATSSVQPSLTFQSLSPQAGTRPTLDVHKSWSNQKVFVTDTTTTVGAANLVPGGFDRQANTFLSWNSTTKELVAATPTISGSTFAGSNATSFVNVTAPATLATSATAGAVRTTANISRSNALAALTIGDGIIGELMIASGWVTIAPDITFAGDGVLFTGTNSKAVLTGVVTAPNGLVKVGPGDLVLSNTTAVGGLGTQTLVVREGRLSGNGSRSWNVVIEGSGIFAPGNSPEVFQTGGLLLSPDTVQEFELSSLDAVSDKIVVAGDLTLDGIIDIIDWELDGLGTMEVGTYDLITWGGTLTDNGVTLGALPDGFFGSLNLNLDRKVLEFEVFSAVVAVPEPAAWALGVAALPAAWLWRRRPRRLRWASSLPNQGSPDAD